MTFPLSIINRIHSAIQNMKITSAGGKNPVNNVVKQPFNIPELGLNEEFASEVVGIIQEEIRIQMTELREDPPTPTSKPVGSTRSNIDSDIAKVVRTIQNPGGLVADGLKILPHAALLALAISLVPIVISELSRPGGLMDVRWKRQVTDEINGFMDRQTQKNTQIGIRGITIQSRAGFIGINGANNSNNLREIREGGVNRDRLARVDITDHSKGLFN